MKRKNFTIRKPFSGGRSLYGPGLMGKSKSKRGTHQRRVRKMVSRYGGYMPEAEAKRLRKSARAGRPHKKQLEGLFHELYGRNPKMCGARARNVYAQTWTSRAALAPRRDHANAGAAAQGLAAQTRECRTGLRLHVLGRVQKESGRGCQGEHAARLLR